MQAQQRGLQHEQLHCKSHLNDFWTCCPISTILERGAKGLRKKLPSCWLNGRSAREKKEEKQHAHTKGKSAARAQKLSAVLELPGCSLLLADEGRCSSSPAPAQGAACPRTQEQAGHYRERAERGLRGNTKLEVTVRKFKGHGGEQQDCVGGWWNREALWIFWGRITKKGSERAVVGRGGHCRERTWLYSSGEKWKCTAECYRFCCK